MSSQAMIPTSEMWYMDTILKRTMSCLLYYDHDTKKYHVNVADLDGKTAHYEAYTPLDLNLELIKHTNGGFIPDGA